MDIYEIIKKSYKAFIGDPNKIKVIKKGLTSEKLQSEINILLEELANLQKELDILTNKKT